MNEPRIAVVHDWLPVFGGAERVLEQILAVFPQADVFSLVDLLSAKDRAFLGGRQVHTSFLQKFGWVRRNYRKFLPLMPFAIERFNLAPYQLILSSSYAVAKGVIARPGQLHVCYCHSPMRYVWDLQEQYLRESRLDRGILGWAARLFLARMRRWDVRTHPRVHHFIANSKFVRDRIATAYGRTATVINPPVDVESFSPGGRRGTHFVTASRLVPYKMIHLIVEAFNRMPDLELRVIGYGPEFKRLSAAAQPNVHMLGHQPMAVLKENLQSARAFVFAAVEDFGIAPLEAQACGTPVIAYGAGGALETVLHGETGIFFQEQTADSIITAVRALQARPQPFPAERIRAHALHFSASRFRAGLAGEVALRWKEKFGCELVFNDPHESETARMSAISPALV